MRKLLLSLFLITTNCAASYTANHTTTINSIRIYNSELLYFYTASMPEDSPCSGTFFALSDNLTDKQFDRYYSMLLAAKTTGAQVTIGYDNTESANCINTRPYAESLRIH
ncbi:hypothetical protein [uncultured Shewanella sp.]|uniref:hypothetical protein n=1 Tax=uncultured Shewanella sp. TaxID=173975 RepID=UPI0026291DA1|nr:hypothetical protein [uncultured Shewanella sp.]